MTRPDHTRALLHYQAMLAEAKASRLRMRLILAYLLGDALDHTPIVPPLAPVQSPLAAWADRIASRVVCPTCGSCTYEPGYGCNRSCS